MTDIKLLFKFLLLGILTLPIFGYKRWTKNANMENPFNWNKGRVPCGNERVIIPDESPSVYIQLNGSLGELILPMTGEMILGDNFALTFTDQPDHSADCLQSDTDIEFNVTHPRSWFDRLNWCKTDTENGECQYPPLLDSEKIPCAFDDVIFPPQRTFFVGVRSKLLVNIGIRTLKIGSQTFTSSTFQRFVSGDGRTMFPVPASWQTSKFDISRKSCTDKAGCKCGNDNGQILTEICLIDYKRCSSPQCSDAITPVGQCCPLCGMMISLTYGVGFSLDKLKATLQNRFISGLNNFDHVQVIVSRTFEDKIQIVLTDPKGTHSKEIGARIQTFLQTDVNARGWHYDVTGITVKLSGGSPAYNSQTGAGGMSSGSIVGLVIGIIIVIILIGAAAGYFFLRKRHTIFINTSGLSDKISFWRSRADRPAAQVAPTIEFRNIQHGGGNVAFDNPLFGGSKGDNVTESQTQPPTFSIVGHQEEYRYDTKTGFDNPLYDTAEVVTSFYTDPIDAGGSTDA